MALLRLEQKHRDFLRNLFMQSGTLGQHLLRYLHRGVKIIEVLTDEEIPEGQPFEWTWRSKEAKPSNSRSLLISRIHSLISGSGAHAIFHDCGTFSPSDACVRRHQWPLFNGEEVYHFVPSHASPSEIARSIEETGMDLLGIIIPAAAKQLLPQRTDVGAKEVINWADNASHIIIEAYDGDAYIIWPSNIPE